MTLAPKFAGQLLTGASAPPKAIHTVELFLDYVCPFSSKMFHRIYSDVLPVVKQKYASKVQFIFRQQIQPWHPSSTLTHEAGVAVLRLKPELFYPFSKALFEKQKEYYDVSVVNETRNHTYKRLAALAGTVGVDADEVYKLLAIPEKAAEDGSLNVGNGVTNDLKVIVKQNRLVGVHVSPTVIFDGVVDNSISSGWTLQQWEEWLEKNVA